MAVTYTKTVSRGENANGKLIRWVGTIAFSTASYSSGVSISGASMGMPTTIEQLTVLTDNANTGSVYEADLVNNKIRIFNVLSGAMVEASGNQTVTLTVSAIGW